MLVTADNNYIKITGFGELGNNNWGRLGKMHVYEEERINCLNLMIGGCFQKVQIRLAHSCEDLDKLLERSTCKSLMDEN